MELRCASYSPPENNVRGPAKLARITEVEPEKVSSRRFCRGDRVGQKNRPRKKTAVRIGWIAASKAL